MEFTSKYKDRQDEIVSLFTSTFAESEGAAEGQLVGGLANKLLLTTPDGDILVFLALDENMISGAIIFTRLHYPNDGRTVFLLSPVAVATNHQGKGVGQKLINHGLQTLRARGVDVAMTYGDINFYSKVGFTLLDEDTAKAPLPLQHPEGWLGQALSASSIVPIIGQSFCASALDDPSYW